MTAPRVSVIIPAYNSAEFLGEALRSSLSQTLPPAEVVVVDDGSTDGTGEVAARFAGVRLLDGPNRGAAAARNLGLKETRGEYVQFLDADDSLSPEKIEAQVRLLSTRPSGHVSHCPWGRFRDDPADAEFLSEPVWRDGEPLEWLLQAWRGGGMMQTGCWLTSRELLRRAGPWDERLSLHDDGEYFARVVLASAGVLFCPQARVRYRTGRADSLSRITGRKAALSALQVFESYRRLALAREDSRRVRRALAANYVRFLYEYHPEHPDLLRSARRRLRELAGGRPPAFGSVRFRLLTSLLGLESVLGLRDRLRRSGLTRETCL